MHLWRRVALKNKRGFRTPHFAPRSLRNIVKALFFSLTIPLAARAGSDVAFVTDSSKFSYDQRYRYAYELGLNLTAFQVNELCNFLLRHPSEDSVGADRLASIKNNVADVLLQQRNIAPSLSNTFFKIIADSAQGALWREYTVQKLPVLCLKTADENEQKETLGRLWKEFHNPTGEFVGTALGGLDRIHRINSQLVPLNEIVEASKTVMSQKSQSIQPFAKVNALQILGSYDALAAHDIAIGFLSDDTAPIMLQASALATLGMTGDTRDLPIIAPFLSAGDSRLKLAAAAAYRKLTPRNRSASKTPN